MAIPSRRFAIALVALAPIAMAGFVNRTARDASVDLFDQVVRLVGRESVDSLSADEIYEKAARGLVANLGDPYASLYSPKELADFMRGTIGNAYGGLGIGVNQSGPDAVVTSVFPNSPGARGGLQPGDQIVAIDGAPIHGWDADHVTQHLTGKPGTLVSVTWARLDVPTPITATFTRANVHAPAVPFALMLDDATGYVPLQRFSETSRDEVAQAITELQQRGAKRFIVDLRGNGGGDVGEAVDISTLFLKRGNEVVTLRQRNAPPEVYRAPSEPLVPSEPVAVLVDGNTASASEIVAGALQDHDRALIVGSTSFGKGIFQSVFKLDDGYALKLTTGKWFTPSGRSIQRDRKFVDGHFVQLGSAELLADSLKRFSITYKSDAGRKLFGGGGITPDVAVAPETLATAARPVFVAMSVNPRETSAAMLDIARRERGHVTPDFVVTPALRNEFYKRIGAPLLQRDTVALRAAAPFVDRLIEQRVLSMSFGDSAAFRRGVAGDAPVQRALRLLAHARSQQQIVASLPG